MPSEDQISLSKFNSYFSHNFFVSCTMISTTYSPSVFFIGGLMLYVFESLKQKAIILIEKSNWKCFKFGLACG